MAESGQTPPRLPDPPENVIRQYVQDLERAIEFFIAQDNKTKVADESQAISWFIN